MKQLILIRHAHRDKSKGRELEKALPRKPRFFSLVEGKSSAFRFTLFPWRLDSRFFKVSGRNRSGVS